MPWAATREDTVGMTYPGLLHPVDAYATETFETDLPGGDHISCPFYARASYDAFLGVVTGPPLGYDECPIPSSALIDVSAAAPALPGDSYYTVYLADPDTVPHQPIQLRSTCLDPADEPLRWNPISHVYESCPRVFGSPSDPVSGAIDSTATTGRWPNGDPTDTTTDWAAFRSVPPYTGGVKPGWLVNPDPLTTDPLIDATDPATVLLFTAAQLATHTFGYVGNGVVDGYSFSGHYLIYRWQVATIPTAPTDAVAMIL